MALSRVSLLLIAPLVLTVSAVPSFTFDCQSEGRFEDPTDCSSFYVCREDDNKVLKATKGSCSGHAFEPSLGKCVAYAEKPECTSRSSRQIGYDPSLSHLCATNGFVCSDCKTLINCVSGKAYPEYCASGFTCQAPANFGGSSTCYTKGSASDDCPCTTPNSFFIDFYNTQGFYFCPLVDSDPMVHRCTGDMTFDEDLLLCVNPDGIPACTQGGVFAKPGDCSEYYTCIHSTEGWVQETLPCDAGLMFDEVNMECSDPCTWPKPDFTCTEEGRFADPAHCGNFFVCVTNPDGGFLQTMRPCPSGYHWDQTVQHCVLPADHSTSCTPITRTTCTIPTSCPAGDASPPAGDGEPPVEPPAGETPENPDAAPPSGDAAPSGDTAPPADGGDSAVPPADAEPTGDGAVVPPPPRKRRLTFRTGKPLVGAEMKNYIQILKDAHQ